jgi:hypothetical protein
MVRAVLALRGDNIRFLSSEEDVSVKRSIPKLLLREMISEDLAGSFNGLGSLGPAGSFSQEAARIRPINRKRTGRFIG